MKARYQVHTMRGTLEAVMITETLPVQHWASQLADRTTDIAQQAVRERGRFVLNLSGGRTPKALYAALRTQPLPWSQTYVVWGDERNVDPDDTNRNERMARETLLNHVGVPDDQVFPWPYVKDADPADLAGAYAHQLRRMFVSNPEDAPWFDLTLLGLGADAHTAGLFPTTQAAESDDVAVASVPPGEPYARLSMTLRTLSSSRYIWLLAMGDEKRSALTQTRAGGSRRDTPAAHVTAWVAYTAFTAASG
jgi:6-phosphogluconolactonase